MGYEKQNRCIHIDWLEVYVLEPFGGSPHNADYYRNKGYHVRERDYGTRVYKEMFEILNDKGDPIIEVRRNPASGDASFNGLVPKSSHIRLPNWVLYQANPITFLMDFLLKHDYVFKRIYRIDIALDFVRFDSGDYPARFVRRYLEGKFRKINQCSLTAHGEDNWNQCDWNSLSWGSKSSMVSTKLYNKTKELSEGKTTKPYIRSCWMVAGFIDDPINCTKRLPDGTVEKVDVWRLEYSMKSACDGWIQIVIQSGKKVKKQRIPHKLSMFDSKEKLWDRFQDLTYHYFRFKHKEYVELSEKYKGGVLELLNSNEHKPLKRKDRCRDKKLFYFDAEHDFTQLSQAPTDAKPDRTLTILRRRLQMYQYTHFKEDVRKACEIILKDIDLATLMNYSPEHNLNEARALQMALSSKMQGDSRPVAQILEEVMALLQINTIF